ncbi:MAG: LON peptidase substrate-binding domain-containing protein [Steroidobacteraceae bacterium]
MSPSSAQIALFPLNTVLYPGGLLPLRVFEPRYLDMVGRCLRADSIFGVVLLDGGSDTSREVSTAQVGTSARIVDFQQLQDGLLGLLCRGERRFRIGQRTRNDDGLNCALVEWLDETRLVPVPAQFHPLVCVLRDAIARLDSPARFLEPNYEDASWVSNRLAELLPLDQNALQRLLEIDDPETRLGLLAPLLDASLSGGSG